MELKQNSNQCVILLHEIYGINSHMNYYAKALYEKGFDVYVPNLLQRTITFAYEDEELAYKNFIENIGFEKAKSKIHALINDLSKEYAHIRLIGFSVGATIAWLCSEHPSVHKVVGFYGSRIRQYTNVIPNAETILLFGEQEKSFNPVDLKISLAAYPNVLINIFEAAHGFADPYSPKYNERIMNDLAGYLFN